MDLPRWASPVHLVGFLCAQLGFIRQALRYLLGVAGPSGFGSSSTGEEVTRSIPRRSQLTAIVTGATSGIGAETARVLAKRGVRVVIPARDLKKAGEVKERIQRKPLGGNHRDGDGPQLFCLNTELLLCFPKPRPAAQHPHLTEDKYEMTFATNYLGHYLLTQLLLEGMVETASKTSFHGRIINLTSVIHRWATKEAFIFDDMLLPLRYDSTRAYVQSKLANIMHAKEIARQLRGAATTCYLAMSPQVDEVSGKYFVDCNESSCSPWADDLGEAHDLWLKTHALIQKDLSLSSSTRGTDELL
ncbi:hypothetical protein HPP92_019834 [Vanilla planifolia]|uniref:Uncharacterized protein n=1 Tax=Vanilla planifolia TaxID=51239 RepID=A0A835UM52_VANPL|nr:hypothetical protein HPP92_019834 [Vanilla planifolia]